MSTTYHLVCDETRQEMWVGQGHEVMEIFYSGNPEKMAQLGRFLKATQGKTLCIRSSHWLDAQDEPPYEEFEEPNPFSDEAP